MAAVQRFWNRVKGLNESLNSKNTQNIQIWKPEFVLSKKRLGRRRSALFSGRCPTKKFATNRPTGVTLNCNQTLLRLLFKTHTMKSTFLHYYTSLQNEPGSQLKPLLFMLRFSPIL